MGYLHSYALVEAARSFHEALRHDSTMVMAHVGLSRVYVELYDPELWLIAGNTYEHFADGRVTRRRRCRISDAELPETNWTISL